jgi:tRNA A37 methylthiotransferase MiaB
MKKYLIETFGCQMNFHDSERMAGLLDQAGYEPTTEDLDADVIVINTCSVREHAEEKLYTRLGELRVLQEKTGHRPVVAVAGCVAQQEGQALLRKSNGHVIDVVMGTQQLKMLPVSSLTLLNHPQRKSTSTPGTTSPFPSGSLAAVTRSRRTSQSLKAATTTARSVWCRTPGATSACAPRPTSSPMFATRSRRAGRRFSCSGRS